jgi:hypothetical protein
MQGTKGSLPKLMNIQMELRKCCNHPFLIAGVEEKEMDALIERFPPDGMSEKEYRIHLQVCASILYFLRAHIAFCFPA